MDAADCRAMVHAFYADLWDLQDKATWERIMAPDLKFRGSLGPVLEGRDAFWGYVEDVTAAVGNYRSEIKALIAETNQAFVRMTFSGIHRGSFMGFAPTGQPVWWDGAGHFRFRGDRIADLWVLGDVHGLRERLSQSARGN